MKFMIVGLKNNYHIERVREEAAKYGDEVVGVLSTQLIVRTDPSKGISFRIRGLKDELASFDLIYLWTTPLKRKWDWILFLKYMYKNYGTAIVYEKYIDKDYQMLISPAWDYYREYRHSLPFPRSAVFFSKKSAKKALKYVGTPAILKVNAPGMARQGKGVFFVKELEELVRIVENYEEIASRFVLREYIPNEGDIRVFIVGYKAIGAMHRIPKTGDFRSNISQGGSAEPFDLAKNPSVRKIAEKAAKVVKAEIAGVDIMLNKYTQKPYILEINHGPQFKGLETLTGVNAASAIVEYFRKRAKEGKKKGILGPLWVLF